MSDLEWLEKNRENIKKWSENPNWRKNQAEATRKANSKPVNQYTLYGEYVKTWKNIKEAARELGISNGNISSCCKGRYKSAGGFIWKFAVCST